MLRPGSRRESGHSFTRRAQPGSGMTLISMRLVCPLGEVAVITEHFIVLTGLVVIGNGIPPLVTTSMFVVTPDTEEGTSVTDTEAGTAATAGLLLASRTVRGPLDSPTSTTEPDAVCPPIAVAGTVTVTAEPLGVGGGSTAIVARFVTPPIVAESSVQPVAPLSVRTEKVSRSVPGLMLTDAGTAASRGSALAS